MGEAAAGEGHEEAHLAVRSRKARQQVLRKRLKNLRFKRVLSVFGAAGR